jgi:hypothetical protein
VENKRDYTAFVKNAENFLAAVNIGNEFLGVSSYRHLHIRMQPFKRLK